MMTYDTWIRETKRNVFTPRSKALGKVDKALKAYEKDQTIWKRMTLISELMVWLDSKDKTAGKTARATAWKTSTRNSTLVDGRGTVERLLLDIYDSTPELEKMWKTRLLFYIPERSARVVGHLVELEDIVRKLLNMSAIRSVCKVPTDKGPNKNTSLSVEHKVSYHYNYINVMGRTIPNQTNYEISFADAERANAGNGKYIWFQDGGTAIADMDATHTILVSGGFSGCAYKLYRGEGKIFGAHIYRGGTDSEANVTLMDEYARRHGWREILHMATRGIVGQGGCNTVMTVSELKGGTVESILVKMGGYKEGGGADIVGTSEIHIT